MHHRNCNRLIGFYIAVSLISGSAFGATRHKAKRHTTRRSTGAKTTLAVAHHPVSHLSKLHRRRIPSGNWSSPTFADSTEGDLVDGEDLVVRRAAVQALVPFNGTVVVSDPTSGRILTIVNQKLAYKSGFQPCSTIKLVAALAGINERVINTEKLLQPLAPRRMTLTEASAHSTNLYFPHLGPQPA